MKIVADTGRCEGMGMCEAMAHEFFQVGQDDTVVVRNDSPAEASRSEVQSAVDSCPVSALRLSD